MKLIKTRWLLPVLTMAAYMCGLPAMDQRQAAAAESGKPDRISVAYCTDCVQFHFQDKDGKAAGADGIVAERHRERVGRVVVVLQQIGGRGQHSHYGGGSTDRSVALLLGICHGE